MLETLPLKSLTYSGQITQLAINCVAKTKHFVHTHNYFDLCFNCSTFFFLENGTFWVKSEWAITINSNIVKN